MILTLTILLACCVVAYLAIVKSRSAGTGFVSGAQFMQSRRQPAAADSKPAVARRDYPAVSIAPGKCACRAALRLEGKRGLPEQIPRLPLSNCDAETCGCKFKQHADRRHYDDRRNPYVGLKTSMTDERRSDERRSDGDSDMEVFKITYN